MKKIRNRYLLISMVFGLWSIVCLSSCEEVINIDLNSSNPKLVVEGWIYNTPGPYRIRLSLTTNYFDTTAAPKVEDALVIVSENDTLIDTLKMGNPGVYRTQKILLGKIGATYTLKIFYNGSLYEAASTLKPIAVIDSLTYEYKEDTRRDGTGYFVSIYFQEPATSGDYYRWVFYKNNKVHKKRDELYASDEFYNGNYIAF
jgi:hypothetical protein